MKARGLAITLCLGFLASAIASPAKAAEPTDGQVRERLDDIAFCLEEGTAAADRWWYAWYGIYTGLTVGQAAVALAVSDHGTRVDMAVGAFSSSLGAVPLGLFPLQARFAAARLRALPEATAAERRAKLVAAEDLLRSTAEEERFGRSWVSHLLGNGVALASGIVLAVGYERPASGITSFVGGVVLTELQILTQPTRAIEDWSRYRRHGPRRHDPRSEQEASWLLVPQPGGIGVAGVF